MKDLDKQRKLESESWSSEQEDKLRTFFEKTRHVDFNIPFINEITHLLRGLDPQTDTT